MNTEETKICTKCGDDCPVYDFNKMKAAPDGLAYWCKACTKDASKKTHAKRRAEGKR